MPFGALKNLLGGQTSVEFVRIGPQHGGDDAGERQTSRKPQGGRSGDYAAKHSSEDSDEEAAGQQSTTSASSHSHPAILPEPADQNGQGAGARKCRFSQSSQRRAHFDGDEKDDDDDASDHRLGSHGSVGATAASSIASPKSVGDEGLFSEGITSRTSGRLSTSSGAPRKNSILDNRMQQLRNLRLELANIRNDRPQRTRMQAMTGMVKDLMNSCLNLRWNIFRRCARRVTSRDFITTPLANTLCSGVILLNAVFIGLELELNDDTGFKVHWFLLESGFLAFFIIELCLRFRAATCKANMRDPWILFDMAMILPGVFDTWVLQFLYASKKGMPRLTLLRLVRLARVARVLRIIRLIRYFHELILLARGILGAVQALSWSLVLIFMILYVSAVLTTSWYNYMVKIDTSILETATGVRFTEWFGSIGASLLTLFQLMTLEGWPEIVRISMQVWPQAWLFFVPFILLTNVSLLNAITAVVVEKVFSIAQNEASDEAKRAEKQRLNALKKLKTLFLSIDVDHNATLDLEEFKQALKDHRVVNVLLELGIARYEADELFECLDLDGNQELSVAEFVDGCLRAVGPAQSKHLLQVQYDLLRNFKSLRSKIGDLHQAVRIVLKQLSRVHGVRVLKRNNKSKTTEEAVSEIKEMKVDQDKAARTRERRKSEEERRKSEQERRKSEEAENAASVASTARHKEASSKREEPRVSSKETSASKHVPRPQAMSSSSTSQEADISTPRPLKTAAGSRCANVQTSAEGPLDRQMSPAKMHEKSAGVLDTRQYKPIGNLLDVAFQEQQAMSKVLQAHLEEMQDLHGHVSEVMALNWEGNRDRHRQVMRSLFVQTQDAAHISNDDEG